MEREMGQCRQFIEREKQERGQRKRDRENEGERNVGREEQMQLWRLKEKRGLRGREVVSKKKQ